MVAVGVLLLLGTPFAVRALPARDADLTAVEVVQRVRASSDLPYTGLVTSRGGVELPQDDSLSSVAKLLGRDGTLRVWWADSRTWRVASLRPTGETDHLHAGGLTTRWVYESKNVTVFPDVPVRLPHGMDLLPPVLGRRVLEGARPEELARLGAERVAGRSALGVRLTPADPQSSVGSVDVWADRETGVPLRVELRGRTGPVVLASRFTDFEQRRPEDGTLSFTPPPEARVRFDSTADLASAADRYADRVVPETLAGLPGRVDGVDSVGVYGRGPTLLLALPVRARDARALRGELRERPGSECVDEGDLVSTGPVSMLLTRRRFGEDWLLAGTVTPAALRTAADEIPLQLGTALPEYPSEEATCP